MEKEKFNHLLANFTSLDEEEAAELSALLDEFPYSQIIHNLAARGAQDSNLPTKEKLLQLSAVYSSDRSALKAMMTSPKGVRAEHTHKVEAAETEPQTHPLHEQILIDLASLQESKRLFEETIEKMEKIKPSLLEAHEEGTLQPEGKETESLIDEIKSSNKKIKPEGFKQREQIEIIDRFIKTQPSITRPKPSAEVDKDNDLSEPSTHFGENIVSETLVEILLKQGKKDKAIEALKKLIWKFPQKKTYFAAQIEELRK